MAGQFFHILEILLPRGFLMLFLWDDGGEDGKSTMASFIVPPLCFDPFSHVFM
jgi:hypothetical protein